MDQLTKEIKKFLEDRGWTDLKPANLAKSISIEAAELLEIFQWKNPSMEEVRNNDKDLNNIKEEAADVLIYVLQLLLFLDLNPEEIVLEKLEKTKKKYPAEIFKNVSNKDIDKVYKSIKNKHRAKRYSDEG